MTVKSSPRVWPKRAALGFAALLLAASAYAVIDGYRAFGKGAEGARLSRMEASPEWMDGKFRNPQPLQNDFWASLWGMFDASEDSTPTTQLPLVHPDKGSFDKEPATGLRVTWLGHSTTLVEIDGTRVLTDPVWSERASSLGWLGPRRWYDPPISLAELPRIDAVVVSHDHYDHLDYPTVSAIAQRKDWQTLFFVPLGVGAHLAYWGVPEDRIVELDWWEREAVGSRGLEIASTPARHASGRIGFDDDAKLWSGWALLGPRHRVYYSGDTGLFPAMRDIGERLGPFDLTMIEVGQYGSAWPDWHLGPEQAVRAHRMVRGRVMLPVHWGTFTLAFHSWTEPIERVLAAGGEAQVPLLVPRPGQSVEPEAPPSLERWWPALPWKTGKEDPIVATQMEAETPNQPLH